VIAKSAVKTDAKGAAGHETRRMAEKRLKNVRQSNPSKEPCSQRHSVFIESGDEPAGSTGQFSIVEFVSKQNTKQLNNPCEE